jgi:phenylalanyl-tRNA synthetase alpha chain
MLDKLSEIEKTALESLNVINDQAALEAWRVANIGRSSPLMQVFAELGKLSKEERPAVGATANRVKMALEAALAEHANVIRAAALAILAEMGFQVYTSREVETDEVNFQLLNFPPNHPARDMQDTFFIEAGERGDNPIVLRTHTSPGQIRAMREFAKMNPENPPPIRIALPGMCYRYEQITARSEIQFNQVEGLVVGENITFADLKGTLIDFARRMFGQNVRTRFRASYFPFTEPSAEMDAECFVCGGKGCPVCKNSGWLEILGCGMVHPIVLQNGGYDPARYSGYAWGMGPERQLMLRYRIDDIRYFWGNDLRFLEQF